MKVRISAYSQHVPKDSNNEFHVIILDLNDLNQMLFA